MGSNLEEYAKGFQVSSQPNALTSLVDKKGAMAFELKLRSTLMEQQLEQEKAMYDHQAMTPEGTNAFANALGMESNPWTGKEPHVPEANLFTGLYKADRSATGRGAGLVDVNALVQPTLENPELFDTYDPRTKARLVPLLAKHGFTYLGKPIGMEKERMIASSTTAIKAVDRINSLLNESKGDYIQYFAPGKIGASKLKADVALLKDLYEKIQTGAASNSREDVTYRTLIAPQIGEFIEDVSDGNFDGELMSYRLQNIKSQLLETVKNRPTAVTKGKDSKANPYKAGNPVSGKAGKSKEQQAKEIIEMMKASGILNGNQSPKR